MRRNSQRSWVTITMARTRTQTLARVTAAMLLFGSKPASAQTPVTSKSSAASHEKKSVIVAPRLIEQTVVPYPAGAEGDAVVVVVLTVNADGTVRSAQASAGEPPFSEVAAESVKQWRFEPATRDGVATAATIRMEVAFHAPVVKDVEEEEPPAQVEAAPPPTRSAGSTAQSVPKEQPKPQQPIEVTVFGEKRAPMVVSLARTEVRQIPGTFGDPFRALEILPGVTPVISGLPYFYVRGAPPGNVGYYLDGIRVPYLFHVGIGPSVVHPGMVDRVDLYSGGYPARYGRYAGGIAAAETTAPNPVLHGEANIRIFDAGALVESGFAGGRGTVLLGGRYSYTAAIISLAAKGLKLDYRDFQTRVSYDVTPKDQLTWVTFGAYDLLAQEANGITTIGFGTEFYRSELRWDHALGADGKIRTAVTLGFDQTAIGGERNAQDRMLGARTEVEKQLSSAMRLRTGVDGLVDSYQVTNPVHYDPDDPNVARFSDAFPQRKDSVVGAHAELGIEVQKGFFVTPGLRVDHYSSGDATAVGIDPRLSAKLKLSENFAIVHAYGVAHQPPSFVVPVPGLALGSLANGLQTAYQTSAGIEWGLAKGTVLTSNVFNNIFTNLSDALSIPENRGSAINQRTKGRGYGFEAFLHRNLTQNLGGFISYTLSSSTRRLGNAVFPAAFDRRHVLNAAVAYNLGRNWRAGTRFVFYTGAPKRTTATTTSVSSDAPTAASSPTAMIADPPRDPAFYRVDLRIEKLWRFGKTTHLSFVAEMLNATMHKEIYNGTAIGPISVPSIGVEGGF